MKQLVAALALTAFATAPAFAAKQHAKDATEAAYPNVAVVDGKVVGADPDPNIRLSLLRESEMQGD